MSEFNLNSSDIASMILSMLINACPRDKQNLVTAITVTVAEEQNAEILIGSDAFDYAHHTNKKWQIDPEYHSDGTKRSPSNRNRLKSKNTGGLNPNYKWLDNVLEQVGRLLADTYQGEYINDLGEPE